MKIGKGSVDWALIDVLETVGELNRNELKGAAKERLKDYGKKASDRAIDKRIEKLKEEGILKSEKVGRHAIYWLNPNADWEFIGVDLGTKKGKKDKHSGENAIARYLLSKDHTDDLKRVIKQWLKEFPIVSTEGVRKWNYPVISGPQPLFSTSGEVKLPVEGENEFIFKDLLFHLGKQDPRIIELWEKFKKMSLEHNAKGKALVSKIKEETTQQVNSTIVRDAGKIKLEVANKLNINLISENLLNFVFHACITWAAGKHEHFNEHYGKFKSRVERREDSLEYWIEDKGFRIAKGLLKEEEFKNKIDNVIKIMIKKSKEDYYPEGKGIADLTGELSRLGDEIKRLLKKQLSYVVFKGECEFLKS